MNGSVILADSITASKIHVDDLYAFDATIGGFKITESSIYSGVKSSIDNTTRGSYLDDEGQFAIGDSANYLKYYKDTDGKYKLAINANSLRFGAGNTSVEDYVSGQIDNLGDDYVKKPVINGQNSQVVTVENALPDSIDGLKLYGKTTQFTTTGKQLANLPDVESISIGGLTWSSKDGIVTVKGTSTYISPTTTSNIGIDLTGTVGTFYISGNVGDVAVYVGVTKDGKTVYNSNKAFHLDGTETRAWLYLQVMSGKTVDNTIYPMLNVGSTALPWEPYTGGIPSPNPEYPQELVSVGADGELSTTTAGKNLIPFPYQFGNKLEVNGCTYTVTDDGGIVCSGTATDFSVAKLGYIPFVTDLTYRIYGDAANVRTEILLYDDNDTLDTLLTITDDTKTIYRADYPSSVTKIFVRIRRSQDGSTLSGTAYPIVVAGTVAPDKYEPYKSTQTLITSTPNGLPGFAVTDASIANHTDADGQMWVCDEIDYGTGEYVQNVYVEEVTSEMVGVPTAYGEAGYYRNGINLPIRSVTVDKGSMSSHFKCRYSWNIDDEYFYVTEGGRLWLFSNRWSTKDEFVAWLEAQRNAGTPFKVVYRLETPIRTRLFESEIEAFKALGNPSGNVTVYSEADISVELSDTSSTKGLEHQIDNVRDTIDQNSELVNQRFALTDELLAKLENCMSTLVRGDNGESLMVQTADGGWTFSMAQYNDLTSALSESVSALQEFTGSTDASVKILQDAVANLQESAEYVRITVWDDEPCIELGEGDSDFKLMITNTRIMFLNGGMTPTYIDTTGLITQNITVNGEIRHGNFRWVQRSNGHYSLIR